MNFQPISSNYTPEGLPIESLEYIDLDGNLKALPLILAERFNTVKPAALINQLQFPPSAAAWPAPWKPWDIDNLGTKTFVDAVSNRGVAGATPFDAQSNPSWAAMLRPFPRAKQGTVFDITKSHLWVINAKIGMYQNQTASDAEQLVALMLSDLNLIPAGPPVDGDFVAAGLDKRLPSVALWANHNTVSLQEAVLTAADSVYVQIFCAWFVVGTLIVAATVSTDGVGMTYANADGSNFFYSLKAPPTTIGLGAAIKGGPSGKGNSIARMDYMYIWGGEAELGLEVPGWMRFTPEGGKLYVG